MRRPIRRPPPLAAPLLALSLAGGAWRTSLAADPATAPSTSPAPASAAIPALLGVNLCGAEFGEQSLPGVYGKHYTYPPPSDLDYFRGKGLTLVRLPFRWERVQRELFAALDGPELGRLDAFLAEAGRRGMSVILDLHNFARYRGHLIGSPDVPYAAFEDLWQKLARHVATTPAGEAVWAYGLMNEPHDTEGFWPTAAQAGMDAVRSVDRRRLVLVGGEGWSNTHVWAKYNPDLDVHDPAGNFLYEGHVYFDHDATGRYLLGYAGEKAGAAIGAERVEPFLAWLAERRAGGFLGEFGVPADDERWLAALDGLLAFMARRGLGGCYWAAGPWWKDYPLSIEPAAGKDRPQMAVMGRRRGEFRNQKPENLKGKRTTKLDSSNNVRNSG